MLHAYMSTNVTYVTIFWTFSLLRTPDCVMAKARILDLFVLPKLSGLTDTGTEQPDCVVPRLSGLWTAPMGPTL